MRNAIIGSFSGFVLAAIFVAACGSGTELADVTALEQRVATLEQDLTTAQADLAQAQTDLAQACSDVAACESLLKHFSIDGNEIYITGANVHVRNWLDDTQSINGLGNVIIGYNEQRGSGEDDRTGSHMLVVGSFHNYSSCGGVVVGSYNTTSDLFDSVVGGTRNTASGGWSSVTGGSDNTASGQLASVSGGSYNTASGYASSVSGGGGGTASGDNTAVSGGQSNTASGDGATVSGGLNQTAGSDWQHLP